MAPASTDSPPAKALVSAAVPLDFQSALVEKETEPPISVKRLVSKNLTNFAANFKLRIYVNGLKWVLGKIREDCRESR